MIASLIRRIRARGNAMTPVAPSATLEPVAAPEPPTPEPPQAPVEPLPPVTHPAIPYRASQQAIDLLHHFEGLARVLPDGRIAAYLCPANVWTIGWGATGRDPFNGGNIGPNTIWTRAQADERFVQHLRQFERDTRAALTVPTTQGQFDALVSFAYNLGNGALNRSTLLRLHNAGDFEGAAKQFGRWNKAGGKVLRGLTRRREAEAAMYQGRPWR
jgi:lysozyme